MAENEEQLKKDYLTSGLNRKGVDYFEKKKWKQALYNFEKSFEINPSNTVLRQNLLTTYGEVMLEAADEGRLEEAKAFQTKAIRLVSSPEDEKIFWSYYARTLNAFLTKAPMENWRELAREPAGRPIPEGARQPISTILHNMAIEAYKKQDLVTAQYFALQALQVKPQYETWELLGDINYAEQKLKDAKTAWQNARDLQNTREIREKLKRISEEMPLEESLEEFLSPHFIVRWNKDAQGQSARELEDLLERAYVKLAGEFQVVPKNKTIVIFYDPKKYFRLDRVSHWSGGIYDGKVRLPYGKGYWERQYEKVVYHELTHAFIYELAKDKAPLWLTEGLAQVEENKIKPIDLTVFIGAKKTGSLFPIQELLDNPPGKEDGLDMAVFYQQSFVLARYLLQQYGWEAMRLLLTKLGRRVPFSQGFYEMTGKGYGQFEIEWLASLKSSLLAKD